MQCPPHPSPWCRDTGRCLGLSTQRRWSEGIRKKGRSSPAGHQAFQRGKELLFGLGPASFGPTFGGPASQWGRQGHGVPESWLGSGLVPAAAHACSPGRKSLLRSRAVCERCPPPTGGRNSYNNKANLSGQTEAPGAPTGPRERLRSLTRVRARSLSSSAPASATCAVATGQPELCRCTQWARVPAEEGHGPIDRHQQPENLQQDFQWNAVAPARVGCLRRRGCGRGRGSGPGLGRRSAGP